MKLRVPHTYALLFGLVVVAAIANALVAEVVERLVARGHDRWPAWNWARTAQAAVETYRELLRAAGRLDG